MSHKRSAATDLNHENWNDEEKKEEAGVFIQASRATMEKRVIRVAKRRPVQNEEEPKNIFGTFSGFKSTSLPSATSSPFSFLANMKTDTKSETALKNEAKEVAIPKETTNIFGSKETSNIFTPKETVFSLKEAGNIFSSKETKSIQDIFAIKEKTDTAFSLKRTSSNGVSSALKNGLEKPSAVEKKSPEVSPVRSEGKDKKTPIYFAKLRSLNESVSRWINSHVDSNPYCILSPIFKDYEKHLANIEKDYPAVEQAKESKPIKKQKTEPTEEILEKKFEAKSEKMVVPETKSIFGNVEVKKPVENVFSKSKEEDKGEKEIFSFKTSPVAPKENNKSVKSLFENPISKGSSIFGNAPETNKPYANLFTTSNSESNPFFKKPSATKTEDGGEKEKPESSSFDGTTSKGPSLFGNVDVKKSPATLYSTSTCASNPFFKKNKEDGEEKEKPSSIFSGEGFNFQQSPKVPNFAFSGTGMFSFGGQAKKPEESSEKTEAAEKSDEDEPPKVEIKPIVEEGAIFEMKCKVFEKKDNKFVDKGVGVLFLKPAENDKMQLIVRAMNSLGNLMLNTLLTSSVPVKRMKDNTIMMISIPLPTSEPPPVPMLLRVKSKEEGDSLFEALEKNKK